MIWNPLQFQSWEEEKLTNFLGVKGGVCLGETELLTGHDGWGWWFEVGWWKFKYALTFYWGTPIGDYVNKPAKSSYIQHLLRESIFQKRMEFVYPAAFQL